MIAIMQPTFMPWAGYFCMMDKVDTFVLLDDVQLSKQSWQTRNRIKTHQGELYLSIPVRKDRQLKERLLNVTLTTDGGHWRTKHLRSLRDAYRKASYFDEVFPVIALHYERGSNVLGEFNSELLVQIAKKIGISTQIVRSSSLGLAENGKIERIAEICRRIDDKEYISPQGSSLYIEELDGIRTLETRGITLVYFEYTHPEYPQLHGNFVSHLAITDLLFNVGFDRALELIRTGEQND